MAALDPAMERPTEVVELSDWENCKENIVPLRGGRNARQLSAVCSQSEADLKKLIDTERKTWESEVANYTGEDPLAPWARYVDWAQQIYVGDDSRQQLISLVERCTKIFSGDALSRYREDPRLLRIWLAYTDYCEDPLEVFNYLKSNKIGEMEAIFYERWASALELRGNQALCQKVYEAGLRKGAHPADWLKARHKAFQMRLVQRIKPTAAQGLSSSSSLSSARRPALAPLSSASSASSSRAGLRPSAQSTSAASRPVAASLGMASSGVRLGSIASRSGSSSASASSTNGKTVNGKTVKSTVYIDPAPTADASSAGTSNSSNSSAGQLPHVASATPDCEVAEGKWRTLAPLGERQKENRPLPQKWSETSLPQKTAAKPPTTESFAIFVDGEFQ